MNELSFYGLDIIGFLSKEIKEKKKFIIKGAPEDVNQGFDLGVTNTLLLLNSLIDSMEPGEVLINTQDHNMVEYTIEELQEAAAYGEI